MSSLLAPKSTLGERIDIPERPSVLGSTYLMKITRDLSDAETGIKGPTWSGFTHDNNILSRVLMLPTEPVYVDEHDQLAYRTSQMEFDKLYKIEWKGEHYALMKTRDGIDFFKFCPDENGG